jgi:putative membrane protein
MTNRPAYLFAGGYLLLFLICAISPYDRAVWWAENIPIFLLVAVIVAVHRYHNFSTISYFLMSFLVVLRTIGGHYTFERFP